LNAFCGLILNELTNKLSENWERGGVQVIFGAEGDASIKRLFVGMDKIEYRLNAAQIWEVERNRLVATP